MIARRVLLALLVSLSLAALSCNRGASTTERRKPEAYVSDPGSVGFDITPLEAQNGYLRLLGKYEANGKLARFGLEFGPTRATQGIQSGHGRFIAEPGSDASVLLRDLAKALGARTVPSKVRRIESLPFTFANIGDNLSQAPRGGFNGEPPGHWSAIKIFIGEGKQEADVFVNINTTINKGQFSIKDPDYGDLVLSYLARVL